MTPADIRKLADTLVTNSNSFTPQACLRALAGVVEEAEKIEFTTYLMREALARVQELKP